MAKTTAKAKSANKSTSVGREKAAPSAIGAPSQHTQSSRKGKRAWRKNVDLQDVEEGMEGLRAEERLTGSTLQKTTNEQLFQIDTTGDAQVRKSLPRFKSSSLTSAKILAQRSAVPSVTSRTSASSAGSKKRKLSHEEKTRLLRTAKRLRRGPLNAYMDPTELGEGSALLDVSEAAKQSGAYDPWQPGGEPAEGDGDDDANLDKRRTPKAPPTASTHPRALISLPAVAAPHQGTSYNPTLSAHQALLRQAHELEARKVGVQAQQEEWNATMERLRKLNVEVEAGVPIGMSIAELADEGEEEPAALPAKKVPERKTKKQRAKEAKLREEKRVLAAKVAQKRLLASIGATSSRGTRSALAKARSATAAVQARRAEKLQEQLRAAGLAGQRLGKHVVRAGPVDVQLGEELSESLRALKPEGNLFRDRYLSLQHRALLEPRAHVTGKHRRTKTKEYEKYAWKRFE